MSGDSFLEEIPNIFQDAQRSLATHRKNAAALRKIFQKHCKTEENEKLFINEFYRNLNKILVIKKGIITADRSMKFIIEFIKFSLKKENGNIYYFFYICVILNNIIRSIKLKIENKKSLNFIHKLYIILILILIPISFHLYTLF